MSRRVGNLFIIEPTPPAKCDLCGKTAQLRPYGPNGENICFACGEKNPASRDRQFARVLFGEDVQ